jgi:hypothetical protein
VLPVTGVAMSLLLSTCFRADVVVSLARGLGVGLKARLLLVTAVLDTSIRSRRLCDAQRAHARKHHEQNDYSFHDDFPFLVFTRCILARYTRCLAKRRANACIQHAHATS